MLVTLDAFCLFSSDMQLRHLLIRGTFLAERWEDEAMAVNLYHLDDGGRGYFVEVGIDEAAQQVSILRSFGSSAPLADYSHGVQLPEGWA